LVAWLVDLLETLWAVQLVALSDDQLVEVLDTMMDVETVELLALRLESHSVD